MGAVMNCSLVKHVLDCVVECPEGQRPQAWETAVGGRILHIKITRPDLPFTWKISVSARSKMSIEQCGQN